VSSVADQPPTEAAAVSTPIRVRARELRLGDLYVTGGRSFTVKREVIGRRETIVADASGDPQPGLELTCSDGTSPLLLADQRVRAERMLRLLGRVTAEDRRDFADAHAEGLHDEMLRDFCPECEARR
jgi:hypothetical protein